MTLEDATWPAVILTSVLGLCRWIGKIVDRWFTQWLKSEETKRERIEEGTQLITRLNEYLDDLRSELKSLRKKLEEIHEDNGGGV